MTGIVINQKEYGYCDIQIVLWGRPILGLKGIDYKSTKTKEYGYGAGRNPRSIQHGQYSHDGALQITQSELQAMNNAARQKGYKSLLDVELDIIVTYLPEDSVALSIDRIKCASFTEMPKGMNEGDMQSTHSLPFIALDIAYGV